MVFAAPPFKHVHPFLFEHRFSERHLNAQLPEKPFPVYSLIIKGQQLTEFFVGHAAHNLMHSQGCNGRQTPLSGSAAGIYDSVLQDFIGILVGAFVHQIEFRVSEAFVGIVCRVFRFLQDFPMMHKDRAKGIMALFPGADGQLIAAFHMLYVIIIHRCFPPDNI